MEERKFITLEDQHLDISKMVPVLSSGWLGFLYLEKQQQASREYRADVPVSFSRLQYVMLAHLWMKAVCSFWWDSWIQGPWQGGRDLLVFDSFSQL
jgi:hypothetical protein